MQMEDEMGKYNKNQSDRIRFGVCRICLKKIPVEYYFDKGDAIVCYECGTEYVLLSMSPVKLKPLNDSYFNDDHLGEMDFDNYDLDNY